MCASGTARPYLLTRLKPRYTRERTEFYREFRKSIPDLNRQMRTITNNTKASLQHPDDRVMETLQSIDFIEGKPRIVFSNNDLDAERSMEYPCQIIYAGGILKSENNPLKQSVLHFLKALIENHGFDTFKGSNLEAWAREIITDDQVTSGYGEDYEEDATQIDQFLQAGENDEEELESILHDTKLISPEEFIRETEAVQITTKEESDIKETLLKHARTAFTKENTIAWGADWGNEVDPREYNIIYATPGFENIVYSIHYLLESAYDYYLGIPNLNYYLDEDGREQIIPEEQAIMDCYSETAAVLK